MDTPFHGSYWVSSGKFLAGAYPGDKDPAEAIGKIQGLLDCGIGHVVSPLQRTGRRKIWRDLITAVSAGFVG